MTDHNSGYARYLNKPKMKPRRGGGRPFSKSPGMKKEQQQKPTQRPMQRKPFYPKSDKPGPNKPNFGARRGTGSKPVRSQAD